jgi:acyl carrier protein
MTTNDDRVRLALVEALRSVAPESDPSSLPDTARIREELDLDSMDFLRFVTAVHQSLGVDIPERDYAQVQTLKGAIDYLTRRQAS